MSSMVGLVSVVELRSRELRRRGLVVHDMGTVEGVWVAQGSMRCGGGNSTLPPRGR